MAQNQHAAESALEIDRLATQLAKDPHSKAFMPLAEEYAKVGMWQEAAAVLEDGLKLYPGFITAMVALGRAYDHMGQVTKARAILEESVKLSPENLRAHRTLIKIYTSQGQNESALQSCAVILAVNPRDEEARSVQSALGAPLKQKQGPERSQSAVPATRNLSAQEETTSPAPVEFTASAPMAGTVPGLPDLTPLEPNIASIESFIKPTELMETALRTRDKTAEQLAGPVQEPDFQAAEIVVMPPPSPHAEVVAQLESWLRSIEARRHDRDGTNEPHPKTS
ncbi:MAG: tetratricopeptide repeat protein [Nitrospirae bacterium]|nr:MAG: tetratricopeptide repeat protein [Nitrospirota bacterium]